MGNLPLVACDDPPPVLPDLGQDRLLDCQPTRKPVEASDDKDLSLAGLDPSQRLR